MKRTKQDIQDKQNMQDKQNQNEKEMDELRMMINDFVLNLMRLSQRLNEIHETKVR